MGKRHQVFNLIILDESGSMESIKDSVITGFNELVQTIKGIESRYPEQEHFISLISFNGAGIKTLHWKEPVGNLAQINTTGYHPQEMTPLFDAMGFGITRLNNELPVIDPRNVLVTVFTDGEENASREYDAAAIKKLVEELKAHNWTFTYIGTDHDVDSFAVSISINNCLQFNKDTQGIKSMFLKEQSSRELYSKKIRKKEDTSGYFYSE